MSWKDGFDQAVKRWTEVDERRQVAEILDYEFDTSVISPGCDTCVARR